MGQRFDIPEMGRISEVKNNTNKEIEKSKELHSTSTLQLKQYLYDINNNRDDA